MWLDAVLSILKITVPAITEIVKAKFISDKKANLYTDLSDSTNKVLTSLAQLKQDLATRNNPDDQAGLQLGLDALKAIHEKTGKAIEILDSTTQEK